ncbi:MAG: hypothetical protein OEZ14_09090, partial [Acidimicrobiia bacterium]|nr:hypothetical protein [Acidimicrobiia bacterium]
MNTNAHTISGRVGRLVVPTFAAFALLVALIPPTGVDAAAGVAAAAPVPDHQASLIRELYSSTVGIPNVSGIVADSSGVVYLIPESADRLVGVRFDEEIVDTVNADVASTSNAGLLDGDLVSLSEDRLVSTDVDTGSTSARSGALNLADPQGMAVDPATGDVFILKATGHQIVRISADGSVVRTPLGPLGQYDLDGLAFNPADGLLYVAAPADDLLWGLTTSGEIVVTVGLTEVEVTDLAGMVFAQTADPTDDPSLYSLYMADRSPAATTDTIYEVSTVAAIQQLADAMAGLVNTTDLSALNPPSSDSSGITYLPSEGSLLVSDSEIEEEPSIYVDVNLWQLTYDGNTIIDTSTTYPYYSDEPTGVSVNTVNGHLLVSDDDGNDVYDVDPGGDGRYGTADDIATSTQTTGGDPEGVVYHPPSGDIFLINGLTTDVERISPGADGRFNDSSDETFSIFDVGTYGAGDPEGIGYDPFTDHLLVLDDNSDSVYELTTSGSLVRTIDISAAGASSPSGIVLAPASDGSSAWHLYIVDRGRDNDSGGDFIDGMMY